MSEIYCYSFVEDEPSAEVLKKLVELQNAAPGRYVIRFQEGFPKVLGGYGQIRIRAQSLLQMAETGIPALVLTDLDRVNCAPTLIRDWFRIRPMLPIELPPQLVFRVAVREVEAWLMADREVLAKYLHISVANFPRAPEDLSDPKQELLGIIRRKGHTTWHQEMLPRGTAHVGPRYNERICEFAAKKWKPERAATNSPSLCRAIESLSRFSFGQ